VLIRVHATIDKREAADTVHTGRADLLADEIDLVDFAHPARGTQVDVGVDDHGSLPQQTAPDFGHRMGLFAACQHAHACECAKIGHIAVDLGGLSTTLEGQGRWSSSW